MWQSWWHSMQEYTNISYGNSTLQTCLVTGMSIIGIEEHTSWVMTWSNTKLYYSGITIWYGNWGNTMYIPAFIEQHQYQVYTCYIWSKNISLGPNTKYQSGTKDFQRYPLSICVEYSNFAIEKGLVQPECIWHHHIYLLPSFHLDENLSPFISKWRYKVQTH